MHGIYQYYNIHCYKPLAIINALTDLQYQTVTTALFCYTDTEPKIQKKWITVRWDPVKQTGNAMARWSTRTQLADYDRIWWLQLTFQKGGGGGHVHTITPSQLTSCINKGSFSSCMSVPSSTFTIIASFPSQRGVLRVSLHESKTSSGKSMQFCNNHHTVISHYSDVSLHTFSTAILLYLVQLLFLTATGSILMNKPK
jgi:hypothetical protein